MHDNDLFQNGTLVEVQEITISYRSGSRSYADDPRLKQAIDQCIGIVIRIGGLNGNLQHDQERMGMLVNQAVRKNLLNSLSREWPGWDGMLTEYKWKLRN